MNRQLRGLSYKVFDVLVVGGGIHGAAIAWEAAHRGLDVALVERDDFGAATSANSFPIFQGALPSFPFSRIRRSREAIRERSVLLRVAPHLVHRIRCVLPLYWDAGFKSRFFLSLGLKVADFLGFDRNRGIEPGRSILKGSLVTAAEALRLAPIVRTEGLTGAAVWYDAQMSNASRLVLSFAMAAKKAGATILNHAEIKSFIRGGRRIIGASVKDRLTGQDFNLWAKITINAAGPWAENVARLADAGAEVCAPRLSAAMNVVVNKPLNTTHAITASAPGGPEFFATPWRGLTLVGTRYWGFSGTVDRFHVTDEDISNFLREFNRAMPGARLDASNVVSTFAGVVPGRTDHHTGDVKLQSRRRIVDHDKVEKIPGLISVVGVKFSTARRVAAGVKLGRYSAPPR